MKGLSVNLKQVSPLFWAKRMPASKPLTRIKRLAYTALAKMRVYTKIMTKSLASLALFTSASVCASSIFSDSFINVWVVDPQTQAVTTYSVGEWVNEYSELSSFNVGAPLQVLVNGLPNSSVPMSPLQAGVSIIGFGEADSDDTSFTGTSQLYLQPGSSNSTQTIEVLMQINAQIVEQGDVQLVWQINEGSENSITFPDEHKPDANGLFSQRIHLVQDGVYEVSVSLKRANQTLSQKQAIYTIASDHPLKEKRDSDSDGVPDLIEAAIGLDPLNSELFADANGDGWSEFDVWLRCDSINIENCSIPDDTDGDGWSDFDEILRGTRHDDYELPVPAGVEPEDESYNQNKLLLQQKPAARRLYEPEYIFAGQLGSDKLESLQAAQLDGTALFSLEDLVSEQDLSTLSVSKREITPAILLANVLKDLGRNVWPNIRLAASQSLAIRASASAQPSNDEGNPSQQISLLVLNGLGDVNIQNFPQSKSGQWQDIVEWRELLIKWLSKELVVERQISFTDEQSAAALLFEASLREEAFLNSENENIRLGTESLPATWINQLNQALISREQENLYAWYNRLAANLKSNSAYIGSALISDIFIASMPAVGTNTSEWLNERLKMPVILEEQGCFVTTADLAEIQSDADFFAQWQLTCPQYYTEVELAQWQAQANELRYLLRMMMFTESAERIALNDSLADYRQDSDEDTLSNFAEVLQYPYATASYPWLEDSDGDSLSDLVDECRIDPINLCVGEPNEPTLALGADISVNIGTQGGIAFLELVLSAPALQEISFTYFVEALVSEGDDAIDGVDFTALSGSLTFIPGQQSMIIPAYLLSNESSGNPRFRLRIEDLDGATLRSNDNVQLVNINRTIASDPDVMLAMRDFSVDERAEVVFDASASTSGIDDPSLRYKWEQTLGTLVDILGADTASARFSAPVTTEVLNLAFEVTVQNALGAQSTASVSVVVNPVDDPPSVNGKPSYTVARGTSLLISYEELLAFITEPDGETLQITQLVEDADGGSLLESTEGYDFTPDNVSGRQVVALENNPLDRRAWIDNGIAYRTANTSADPGIFKIHTWTPTAGSEVVDENSFGYSGILTSIEQEIIVYSYTNQDTSSTVFKWRLPDNTFGEFDTGGFASLFGAFIDERGNALYHCMNSQWERIDIVNKEAVSIPLSCSRFGAAKAVIDDKLCLTSDGGIYCSANGFDFERVFQVPVAFARIDRVFSSDIGTLVLYNDNTNQFIAHVDGQINGQLLYTLDDYFNAIKEVWIDDTFYTLLPVRGDGFEQGVQLFKWQAGDKELKAIGQAALLDDQVSRNEFNQLIKLGDNLLWFGQKSLSANARFLIDIKTGEFTQVSEDISGNRTLQAWGDSALFSSERLESACQWFELDGSGQILDPNNPELAKATCFGRIVYGDTLAYTLFNSEKGFNEFFVKYGASGLSETQFTVRVEDENGNAVNLVVSISIIEGAN